MSEPDDCLSVWHEQRLFGELWRNPAGTIGFRYDPERSAGDGFAVSRSLALATGEFAPEDGTAQRWFANLLPEGTVREHISQLKMVRFAHPQCLSRLKSRVSLRAIYEREMTGHSADHEHETRALAVQAWREQFTTEYPTYKGSDHVYIVW